MKNVCRSCIEDPAFNVLFDTEYFFEPPEGFEHHIPLKRFDCCSYCSNVARSNAIAVEDLANHILAEVGKEYHDPVHELPYDSEEGGYFGNVIDNPYDLFEEIDFGFKNSDLMQDVLDALAGEVWLCRRDSFTMTPSQRLSSGWSRFCKVIKHERRYTFSRAFDDEESEYHPDYLPTASVLAEIADNISTASLAKPLSTSQAIWRARVHSAAEVLGDARDIAAPPVEYARYANRMSPAGVSMFYGSDTIATAIAEVVGRQLLPENKAVTVASFKPASDLLVLDLADLPAIPSFFDERDSLRHALYFLNKFSQAVSQPIDKDGIDHIEYVPTQAFTEFVRYEITVFNENSIDGIRYKSAAGKDTCFAIFADHEACLPKTKSGLSTHGTLLNFKAETVQTLTSRDANHLAASATPKNSACSIRMTNSREE